MDKEFYFEEEDELNQALRELHQVNPSLAKAMKDDLIDVHQDDSNVLMVGTDGDFAVTIIHVPKSSIYNKRGPILLPTTEKHRVVAAISREAIKEWMNKPENQSIDPLIMKSQWEGFLQDVFERVLLINARNPHPIIDDIDPTKEIF